MGKGSGHEPKIADLEYRKRDLMKLGLSSSQAGRRAFRELADKRAQEERDGQQQKGRKS